MTYRSVNGKLVKSPKVSKDTDFLFNGVLDYQIEFKKAVKMVVSEVIPFDTRMTKHDFDSRGFGSCGFLMALVPIVPTGVIAKVDHKAQIEALVDTMACELVSEDWMLIRTWITRDITYAKFREIHDTLHCAFVVYSTAEHIATLSEDRDLCLALRDLRDPLTAINQVKAA